MYNNNHSMCLLNSNLHIQFVCFQSSPLVQYNNTLFELCQEICEIGVVTECMHADTLQETSLLDPFNFHLCAKLNYQTHVLSITTN